MAIFGRPFVKRFALRCRTVVLTVCLSCPVLSCPVCLSVTLVYCGQMLGRIKMTLATLVGLGPGHSIRWGPSFPSRKGAQPPTLQFSAHVSCGQTAGWIKMPLGMEVGLGPGDFMLDADHLPLSKKGTAPPIFGPYLLWPNGWMDQDGTWYGGEPRSRPHCARWGPSSPSPKRGQSPHIRPVSLVAKRLDGLICHLVWR